MGGTGKFGLMVNGINETVKRSEYATVSTSHYTSFSTVPHVCFCRRRNTSRNSRVYVTTPLLGYKILSDASHTVCSQNVDLGLSTSIPRQSHSMTDPFINT